MDGIPQKRSFQSPRKAKPPPHSNPKPSHSSTYPIPQTPQTIIPCGSSLQVSTPETLASRRSSRRASLDTPQKSNHCKTSRSSFSPVSPDQSEASKRKRGNQAKGVVTNAGALRNLSFEKGEEALAKRRRVYYKTVVYDGREFVVGDDVYVKRREDPEIEECMACFKAGKAVMVACDDCLGGFHLKCLNPPLKGVPEGDWLESILRHCYVMNPKDFAKATNEGDDVFLCEYEYDIHWHSFKRLADMDMNRSEEDGEETESDEGWDSCSGQEMESEETVKISVTGSSVTHQLDANSRKGRIFGLQKIGTKRIPEQMRCHKQIELERAKLRLMLTTLPKCLPCRNKEMEEITAFIKGAICDDHCLGHCLYVHGAAGTAKVLYNILDWPTKSHSRLIVIGIANTMDLPEKLLPCISRRMGVQRLCFGPYNYQQLQEIILSRLKRIDAFEKQAAEFASRKVALYRSSYIWTHRALEICRCAVELTDSHIKQLSLVPNYASAGTALVGMSEVEAAIRDMFQAPHIQLWCMTFRNQEWVRLHVKRAMEKHFQGGTHSWAMQIVICEAGAKHRLQELQLNFPSEDVAFALKE